jgi:hypothetical protein
MNQYEVHKVTRGVGVKRDLTTTVVDYFSAPSINGVLAELKGIWDLNMSVVPSITLQISKRLIMVYRYFHEQELCVTHFVGC